MTYVVQPPDGPAPVVPASARSAHARLTIGAGVGAILIGIGYGLTAVPYGLGTASAPGAGLFPVMVAVLVVVSGMVMLVSAIRQHSRGQGDRLGPAVAAAGPADESTGLEEEDERPARSPRLRVATVIGTLAGYVIIVTWFGHLITATVVVTITVRLLGGRPWWQAACFGLALAVGTQLLFRSLLGLPLPQGLYGPRL